MNWFGRVALGFLAVFGCTTVCTLCILRSLLGSFHNIDNDGFKFEDLWGWIVHLFVRTKHEEGKNREKERLGGDGNNKGDDNSV
mmetsp:Transcript_21978/g.37919  ORF Transcript_21978/g.37919 Transcript_21978/m.37919 type:complete len:84 (+) Transcript_21978:231-482(+)|eukprot:CAMPEP_0184696682 /NCGR_PEP_ID=MMETSP0313-20130426/3897_1 /TAXON_ID=2792 /ORGANISM="Porphyridium aerugineum, Strain SAG 1380-2" /LENGTH=83 /DNA_ID=CAMNT_0027155361 /DNA_START=235 /DNA_END=486 /DNA_ORIENTATION=-